MSDRRDPLAPGGDHALVQGCACPVLDNGHGDITLARDRGGWWITSDCPLHGRGGTQLAHTEIPARNGPHIVLDAPHHAKPCWRCGGEEVVQASGPDEFGNIETDSCPECAASDGER